MRRRFTMLVPLALVSAAMLFAACTDEAIDDEPGTGVTPAPANGTPSGGEGGGDTTTPSPTPGATNDDDGDATGTPTPTGTPSASGTPSAAGTPSATGTPSGTTGVGEPQGLGEALQMLRLVGVTSADIELDNEIVVNTNWSSDQEDQARQLCEMVSEAQLLIPASRIVINDQDGGELHTCDIDSVTSIELEVEGERIVLHTTWTDADRDRAEELCANFAGQHMGGMQAGTTATATGTLVVVGEGGETIVECDASGVTTDGDSPSASPTATPSGNGASPTATPSGGSS